MFANDRGIASHMEFITAFFWAFTQKIDFISGSFCLKIILYQGVTEFGRALVILTFLNSQEEAQVLKMLLHIMAKHLLFRILEIPKQI